MDHPESTGQVKSLLWAFLLATLVGGFTISITATSAVAQVRSTSPTVTPIGNNAVPAGGKIPPNFPQPAPSTTTQTGQKTPLDNGPQVKPKNVIQPAPPIQQRVPAQPRQ